MYSLHRSPPFVPVTKQKCNTNINNNLLLGKVLDVRNLYGVVWDFRGSLTKCRKILS